MPRGASFGAKSVGIGGLDPALPDGAVVSTIGNSLVWNALVLECGSFFDANCGRVAWNCFARADFGGCCAGNIRGRAGGAAGVRHV